MTIATILPPIDPREYPCARCPDAVHSIPGGDDEWWWGDETGSVTGTDPEFRHLPDGNGWARLAELDAAMTAIRKRDPKLRDPDNSRANDRMIKEYVALKVRLDLSGSFHVHRPRQTAGLPSGFPGVSHCDYPAYRRPSGWQCRTCRVSLGDDSAVGFDLIAARLALGVPA